MLEEIRGYQEDSKRMLSIICNNYFLVISLRIIFMIVYSLGGGGSMTFREVFYQQQDLFQQFQTSLQLQRLEDKIIF